MSGIPLRPVYGPDDAEHPGVWPYTRGPYASMYRSKLWTMRMFAGFGTAEDTNVRFKEIIRAGGDGLSTAFDMPTLLGLDSDDPMSLGEVGRCGVAIDTLADMRDLFSGIDLGAITTSMTINSPAAPVLAMFVAQAEETGIPRRAIGGTLQNDILKEYQAQKEFVFPPRQSMRLVRDVISFTAAEMPRWHSVSISGYHIREAGSTAAEELASKINKLSPVFTLDAGETGKAFGSITAKDIHDRIVADLKLEDLPKHAVVLEKPIKESGEHTVAVKLHADVSAKLKLIVKVNAPAPAAGEASDEGASAKKPRRKTASSAE